MACYLEDHTCTGPESAWWDLSSKVSPFKQVLGVLAGYDYDKNMTMLSGQNPTVVVGAIRRRVSALGTLDVLLRSNLE